MKTISIFRYLLLSAVIAVVFSCKGDDGQDGNANVLTVKLQSSAITWTAGTYLARAANVFTLTEEHVDEDIIDHGTVLGYCYVAPQWIPLPFFWIGASAYLSVTHTYELNKIHLYAYSQTGVIDPNAIITEYRFMLITDKTVMKGASASQEILYNLRLAWVDVNNYYEVAEYFGVKE